MAFYAVRCTFVESVWRYVWHLLGLSGNSAESVLRFMICGHFCSLWRFVTCLCCGACVAFYDSNVEHPCHSIFHLNEPVVRTYFCAG